MNSAKTPKNTPMAIFVTVVAIAYMPVNENAAMIGIKSDFLVPAIRTIGFDPKNPIGIKNRFMRKVDRKMM